MITKTTKVLLGLVLACGLVLSLASVASAAPPLGVSITHNPSTVSASDFEYKYEVKVKNTGASAATCKAGTWGGTPAPTFTYQWYRDGASLGSANGAQTATYTPQVADTGHSLQCQVTGTNTVSAVTTATTAISAPLFYGSPGEIPAPAPKEPAAASARPTISGTGTAERTCTAPTGWKGAPTFTFQWLRNGVAIPSTTATATTTSGSTSLTAVTTATGSGELTGGSKNVTGVTTSTGAFRVGQTITATGIPAATTIKAVGAGTIELSAAATETAARSLTAGSQPIAVGDAISGTGIPTGTTVTAISGQTITMSAAATASGTGVTVTATATGAKYKPNAATGEEDLNKVLQCQVLGTNSSGSALGISLNSVAGTVTTPPENTAANTPTTFGGEWVTGTTTALVSLPEGIVMKSGTGTGWVCTIVSGSCTSSTGIAPGGELPVITLTIAVSENAPESVSALAFASNASAVEATAQDLLVFGPPIPFEIAGLQAKALDESEAEDTQAGSHPFRAYARFEVPRNAVHGFSQQDTVEDIDEIWSDLPVGFVGNPQSVPTQCPEKIFEKKIGECPPASAVGQIALRFGSPATNIDTTAGSAVFKVEPEKGYAAEFGFNVENLPFLFRVKVRSDKDYGITVVAPKTPQAAAVGPLSAAKFTFCAYGARFTTGTTVNFNECYRPDNPNAHVSPLLTIGTKCAGGPPRTEIVMDSWEHQGSFLSNGFPDKSDPNWKLSSFDSPQVTGCQQLTEEWVGKHKPSLTVQPDNTDADTPAGYTAHLHVPQEGLFDRRELATSHLKDTRVILAPGPTLNPSVGDGISTCSEEQMGMISESPLHFDMKLPHCPDGSKLGNAEVVTPLLENPLRGSIYLAAQHENPFHSDYAIYLVIEEPESGIIVKLAGKVVPNPVTGQLTTVFTDNPELPFEDLVLRFFGGGRASLANPTTCGTFTTESELTPWSAADPGNPQPDEIAVFKDPINIVSGPGGSSCSGTPAQRPFNLDMESGSENSKAGATSPFHLRITRPDGNQELSQITVNSPPGYAAYLKGIPTCTEAQITEAEGKSGLAEREHSSCPADSRLGSINSGAGAGPTPLFTPGNVYLGGPYKGAPLSLVTITPALAGGSHEKPAFDLGNVVVRVALYVNRQNAQITAKSDPIPRILNGIPLRIRDIRVSLDRPHFGLNPTSCDPNQISVTATGSEGATTNAVNRFQVGGCENLGFAPKLKAHLTGPTKRGGLPAFTAELTYPEGAYANLKDVQVTLPHSEFLEQAHIDTICTRPQAAANACPEGSIYGYAEAETPLLDGVLKGPVFLKSSDHKLPDLAIFLKGPESQPVEVEFAGRIDSVKGQIRDTIEGLPDVPVSRFTLKMKGGKKGLLTNSRDLCASKVTKMTVRMVGQNNSLSDYRPPLNRTCKGSAKAKRSAHRMAKRGAARAEVSGVVGGW